MLTRLGKGDTLKQQALESTETDMRRTSVTPTHEKSHAINMRITDVRYKGYDIQRADAIQPGLGENTFPTASGSFD